MSMKDTYIYKKHASDSFRAAGLGMEQSKDMALMYRRRIIFHPQHSPICMT